MDNVLFGAVTLGAAGRLAWIINLCMKTLLGFLLTWQEGGEEALGASILWGTELIVGFGGRCWRCPLAGGLM